MNDESESGRPLGNVFARWTRGALTALVSIVMFAMMMLTTADVAGRALVNTPIPGSFEIVTFLLAILIFASLPLITWDEKHISVNLLARFLPGAFQRILDAALSAISTAVVAGVTYRMWIQGNLMAEGQHITGFLEWPIAPIAYAMAALSALTTAILVLVTWHKLRGHGGPAPGAAANGLGGGEAE